MDHQLVTRKFALPEKSTVDSLTELFRAALAQQESVQKVVFTAEPLEMSIDVFIPVEGLPDVPVPEGDPENVWQSLVNIDLEEVEPGDPKLVTESVSVLSSLMLQASRKKMAGVGWVVGDVKFFLKWLGVRVKNDPPATFWNLPLIQLDEFQKSSLVLLGAKSSRVGPLRAEVGFLTHMKEAEDVGS